MLVENHDPDTFQCENLQEVECSLWNQRETNLCDEITLKSVEMHIKDVNFFIVTQKEKPCCISVVIMQRCSPNSSVQVF